MASFSDDPHHWRIRAEQARTHADQLTDQKSKEMMIEIADSYDRLAKRAQERAKSGSQSK
jgi:rubrerythrin